MKDFFQALQYHAASEDGNSTVAHGNFAAGKTGSGADGNSTSAYGYTAAGETGSGADGKGTMLDLYSIANPDGSPRWVFPAHATHPHFLKFYHIGGWRPRMFALATRLIFLLHLQRFVYRKERWFVKPAVPEEQLAVNLAGSDWSLFTGTAGPNNKMVLFADRGSASVFIKIPSSASSRECIRAEYNGTHRVSRLRPASFRYPGMKTGHGGTLEIENIGEKGARTNKFSILHQRMLNEMYSKTARTVSPEIDDSVQSGLRVHDRLGVFPDQRIPAQLLSKMNHLSEEVRKRPFITSFSHGDFTPWNMFDADGKLSVYDWELASESRPLGFDAFHYVMQKGILIERKPWVVIREEMVKDVLPWLSPLIAGTGTHWEHYLKLYLFVNISMYLDMYHRQEQWHMQVQWLMEVWNEALSDVLSGSADPRGMLIEDVFGLLKDKPYGVVKMPDVPLSQLDSRSDIDICITRKGKKELLRTLKHHPLVKRVVEKKRSFMSAVQIRLINNDVLYLDLVWQFKRRHLQMMDAGEVLKRTHIHASGVKTLHPSDLTIYLGLFYGLNNCPVPRKYGHLMNPAAENRSLVPAIANPVAESMDLVPAIANPVAESMDPIPAIANPVAESMDLVPASSELQELIRKSHREGLVPAGALKKELGKQKANRGFSALKNRYFYLLDTIRSLRSEKGMTITFSGVDGAGKSTVISRVQQELDKRFRRRVVVLRHRPSILPILSAWTKGKEQAERDAANTLPRQGGNKSLASSLLRFMYYYTDYLLGQYVIYLRHVRRGDIVLYDRYYFDFINDSLRSNIGLPESITRTGYKLLIKPDFNFFLYADADVILSRKQELDREAIGELTTKYLMLFKQLEKDGNGKRRYIPIENDDLDATVSEIISSTILRAA